MIKFIADIGSNHNNDIKRINKFAKVAKEAGFWGIKYQLFDPETLLADKTNIDIVKKNALKIDLLPKIIESAKKNNIKIGITPFYQEEEILKHKFDFIKISSFDCMRFDLIDYYSKYYPELIISVGLADNKEVTKIIERYNNNKLTIMHCVSNYPTLLEDVGMARIKEIDDLDLSYKNHFLPSYSLGYSDHTVNSLAITMAAKLFDVSYVEVHLDLDKQGNEWKYGHCWLPDKIEDVISTINFDINKIVKKYPFVLTKEKKNGRAGKDGKRPMECSR